MIARTRVFLGGHHAECLRPRRLIYISFVFEGLIDIDNALIFVELVECFESNFKRLIRHVPFIEDNEQCAGIPHHLFILLYSPGTSCTEPV